MEKLVDGKLTRHIGVSNFSIEAIEKLNDGARIRPEMNQIEIHPYMQQDRLVDYCRDTGLLVTAYSPLGSRGNRVLKDPVVVAVAQKHDCTPAQAVLAWLMARDIVVIPKSVHEQRLRENFEATDVALDEDDMRRMASIERHERMSDGSFALFEDGPYTVYDLWGAGIRADYWPQETIGIRPAKPLCFAKDAIDLSASVQSRPESPGERTVRTFRPAFPANKPRAAGRNGSRAFLRPRTAVGKTLLPKPCSDYARSYGPTPRRIFPTGFSVRKKAGPAENLPAPHP